MKKVLVYRANAAFRKFLTFEERSDFEVKVFPEGTEEGDIDVWIREKGAREYLMDDTCIRAWQKVKMYGWPTPQGFEWIFRSALEEAIGKLKVEEAIGEIVGLMLKKEVPDKIVIVQKCLGDHNLFGEKLKEEEVAEKLRVILEEVTGVPVKVEENPVPWKFYSDEDVWGEHEIVPQEDQWVFVDRHHNMASSGWHSRTTIFRLPMENLVQDAWDFGVEEIDIEGYAEAIRQFLPGKLQPQTLV